MSNRSFKAGDVVRIDPNEKCFERDYSLRGKCGEVVAVDSARGEYSVQVDMGRNFRAKSWPDYERLEQGVGWFMPGELELQEGWTSITRAEFLFVHSVNVVYSLSKPWHPENRCMHEDHTDEDAPLAVRRAMVNVWGTVQEIDVCEEHLDQDGRCADDVPYRKAAEKAAG